MAALLMVRAQLMDPAAKAEFDRWYQIEHLPDALNAFKARRAFRCWSRTEPSVHVAFYEFDDLASANAIQDSAPLRELIAEFDRAWGDKVRRSREILQVVQTETA